MITVHQVQLLAQEPGIVEMCTVSMMPFDRMARRLGFLLYKLVHCMLCAQAHGDTSPVPFVVRMEGSRYNESPVHLITHGKSSFYCQ